MTVNKQPLLKRRRRLGVMAQTLRRQLNESETESSQELSSYDNHPADLAASTLQRELALGLAADFRRRLNQVERARSKMEEGTYGLCDRCGQPIPESRLEALPESIFCARCQTIVAQQTGLGVRTDDLGSIPSVQEAPAWEDLAQYGTSDSPQDAPNQSTYAPPIVPRPQQHGNPEGLSSSDIDPL